MKENKAMRVFIPPKRLNIPSLHHIFMKTLHLIVEEHRSLGGSIISRLYYGAFVGLIYELLVFS